MIHPPPIDEHTKTLIRLAVREDLGDAARGIVPGDRTAELAIPQELRGTATIVARRPGIVAGTYLLALILEEYGSGVDLQIITPDGAAVLPEQPIARLAGPTHRLLSAERVLLNFLGHLSGIATLTRRYVDAVASAPRAPAICDTRKTTPGFRTLDKYAVTCGGGINHRMGLYDGVMLKDNHLAALRARLGTTLRLAALTARIRSELSPAIPLWLEVDTLAHLEESLPGGGADIILLDNMTPAQMRTAVALRDRFGQGGKPLLEASGGITLDNIAAVAGAGVDRISIGALTHSAAALDVAMEMA